MEKIIDPRFRLHITARFLNVPHCDILARKSQVSSIFTYRKWNT